MRLSTLAALAATSSLSTAHAAEILHFETLSDLRTAVSPTGRVAGKALTIEFMALGQTFRLDLEPNPRLHALHARLGMPGDTVAYRGSLTDQPDSWVRLVRSPRGLAGIISDGQSLFGLETPFNSNTSSHETVIFRLDDLHIESGTLQCDAQLPAMTASVMLQHIEAETVVVLAQAGATYNLDIGAVADHEFVQAFGAEAEAALLARLNNVDGIFSSQLGIQLTVAETDLFPAEPDPFTATEAHALLDELAIYRGNTATQDALGLTYLFTGRNLDGQTAGVAYVGALCARRNVFDPDGRSYGVGLSEGNRGLTVDSLVAAHEIGHSFGAPHDAEAGSACESTEPMFLMAATVNGSDQFSQCSIEQMQPEITAADCLTPIGQPDLLVTGPVESPVVGVGAPFDYPFRITNVGVEGATGVRLTVELGSGLVWDSPSAETAMCELMNDSVLCSLAPLAGGADTVVTLILSALAEASWPLAATISADLDVNSSNDTWTDTVTARPLVDLRLTGAGAAITVDAARTVPLTLTNLAEPSATDIELSLEASSGLRIDAVSVTGGGCTNTNRTATCSVPALASGSAAALSLDITALTAGSQSVVATVASRQPDQNAADNTLGLGFDAGAPAPQGGSGGGNAGGLLLALAVGLASRRLRRTYLSA